MSRVRALRDAFERDGCPANTAIIAAYASDSPGLEYLALLAGGSLAETSNYAERSGFSDFIKFAASAADEWIIRHSAFRVEDDVQPRLAFAVFVLAITAGRPAAHSFDDHSSAGSSDSRIERLEQENSLLRSQLAAVTHRLDDLESQPQPACFELADLSWNKGEYRVVPYGIGWLTTSWDSSRTAPGAFPLYVESDDIQGESSFNVSTRATRFGVDVGGPEILGAASAGKIEFDFFGRADTENRASVLLRHAYGEFRTDEWRLLGGQTWDVISPLWPNTANYSVGWAAGNVGFRRPQVRVEYCGMLSESERLILQASINRTIVADFFADEFAAEEDAGWPTVMARAAFETGSLTPAHHPVVLGVSGHIGEQGVDFRTAPLRDDARFLTWSVNADLEFPVTDDFGVRGEYFWGQALSTFFGGINQGIDRGLRDGIRSMGGWVEFWYQFNESWHTHAGYGIDDPHDNDLSAGRRSQNQFYFGNLFWDVTPLFQVGVEVSHWQTNYVDLANADAVRIETVMKYEF